MLGVKPTLKKMSRRTFKQGTDFKIPFQHFGFSVENGCGQGDSSGNRAVAAGPLEDQGLGVGFKGGGDQAYPQACHWYEKTKG